MTEIGDWRYFVEYLDYAKGLALIKARGGGDDGDALWDFCDQDEIVVRKDFPTKSKAIAWAQRNKKLDVFHTPRIIEQTYIERPGNRYLYPGISWEETGYWEVDGREISEIGASL